MVILRGMPQERRVVDSTMGNDHVWLVVGPSVLPMSVTSDWIVRMTNLFSGLGRASSGRPVVTWSMVQLRTLEAVESVQGDRQKAVPCIYIARLRGAATNGKWSRSDFVYVGKIVTSTATECLCIHDSSRSWSSAGCSVGREYENRTHPWVRSPGCVAAGGSPGLTALVV